MAPSGRGCLGMRKSGPTSIFDRSESAGLIAARSARKPHGSCASRRGETRRASSLLADYRDLQWISGTTWKEVCSRQAWLPSTVHKRYRQRIAHSDRKQSFRQCEDTAPPWDRLDNVTARNIERLVQLWQSNALAWEKYTTWRVLPVVRSWCQ